MFACPVSCGLQKLTDLEDTIHRGPNKHGVWCSLIEADHSLDLALLEPSLELAVHIGIPIGHRLSTPELRDPFQVTAFVGWPGTPGIVPVGLLRTIFQSIFFIATYHETFPVTRNWSMSTLSALGHARPALLDDVTARPKEIREVERAREGVFRQRRRSRSRGSGGSMVSSLQRGPLGFREGS